MDAPIARVVVDTDLKRRAISSQCYLPKACLEPVGLDLQMLSTREARRTSWAPHASSALLLLGIGQSGATDTDYPIMVQRPAGLCVIKNLLQWVLASTSGWVLGPSWIGPVSS